MVYWRKMVTASVIAEMYRATDGMWYSRYISLFVGDNGMPFVITGDWEKENEGPDGNGWFCEE